ncbi:MAG: hypothetical protein AB1646_24210 [Thermodesulfobacteriota bacterium]
MTEDYRNIRTHRTETRTVRDRTDTQTTAGTVQRSAEQAKAALELSLKHEQEYKRRASRRKWLGTGLLSLGLVTTFTGFPFYVMWALYLGTWGFLGVSSIVTLAGLGIAAAGGMLALSRPKLGDTSRALLIAMKYGSTLTVTRLALEMDISFKKAERIVQDLVKSGIAEIDLEHSDAAGSLVYRIRGL